jgi:hypothetical protein
MDTKTKPTVLPEVVSAHQNVTTLDVLEEAFDDAVSVAADMAHTLRLKLLEEKRSLSWIQFATD